MNVRIVRNVRDRSSRSNGPERLELFERLERFERLIVQGHQQRQVIRVKRVRQRFTAAHEIA